MTRRKFILSLSVVSLLSLTGCGGTPASSGTSGGEPSSSSASGQSGQSGTSDTSQSGAPSSSQSGSDGGSSSSSRSSSQEAPWSGTTMPDTQNIVLFCAKNTGYSNVYAWVTAQQELTSAWPGDAMDSYDDNWFAYTFESPTVTAFNVIFNGTAGKTADLTDVVNGAGYYWYTKSAGFQKSQTMPNPGGGSAPSTEVRTIEGPGAYTGGVDNAASYTDFTFWKTHPSSYWTCINKYNGARKDFREDSIYFAITSRFYNGDPSNDADCWDGGVNKGKDPAWRGDFKGLIEKMDYIKALGFTAIWITPVVSNASGYDYHGYHSINHSMVDPRYYSEDIDFQTVINEAHKRDMKICLDAVFNHTGNFGDEHLFPMFVKDPTVDPDDMNGSIKLNVNGPLLKMFPNYGAMKGEDQFQARVKTMMSDEGDPQGIYHHDGGLGSWEVQDEQVKNIAGDCIDLNTENPRVAEYLVDSYGHFIRMGVDAFRIDTLKHINRLTLNKYFFPALREYARRCRGDDNFFMFGEVCARVTELYNHGIPSLSPSFYTWAENKSYAWGDKKTNYASAKQHYYDYVKDSSDSGRTSNNCYLNGTTYHAPDHSKASGASVIDFRMHRSFANVGKAYSDAVKDDCHFNDATYNVVYVDSHDYSPEPDEKVRPNFSPAEWAEKMNLMFTFRGIPCLFYGTETQFQKGQEIDAGLNKPLAETGRAYYGDHLEGTVNVSGFGQATATGEVSNTLKSDLSKHLQVLNRARLSCKALQMGQYKSVGDLAFIKRYTDGGIDSVACVVMSGTATFSGLPNGKYVDLITGDTKNGTSFTASASGQGNIRIYVLNGSQIGTSKFAK